MIRIVHGDILESDAEALVNPVNCVGVMGAGLALRFKHRFPDMFDEYRRACRSGEVVPGKMWLWAQADNPLFGLPGGASTPVIVNFPTKRHWRDASRLEDITDGLRDLVATICSVDIRSIAIPALGCGLGGLAWADVESRIRTAFRRHSDVDVQLYAPKEARDGR